MAHVVFIHGVCNKPEELELQRIWLRTLKRSVGGDNGLNLTGKGVRSSMVYWADVLYESPDQDIASHESVGDDEVMNMAADAGIEDEWRDSDVGQEWMDKIAEKYGFEEASPSDDDTFTAPEDEADGSFERLPLPWFIKRRILKAFVRDTHHYLFNVHHSPRSGVSYDVQDEIRQRFVAKLEAAAADGGPLVVVSHSQGTIIAYDCLKRVESCPQIDALITIGCPLGIDEVQDKLKPEWTRKDGFPNLKVAGDWVNIFDPLDVVARLDTGLSNDFRKGGQKVISDIKQKNKGIWTHSMTKYLVGRDVRNALRRSLDIIS